MVRQDVKWRASLREMRTRIENITPEVYVTASEIMEDVAMEGFIAGRDQILNATTRTGALRAARGHGLPGRYESGRMFDNFQQYLARNKYSIVAKTGWNLPSSRLSDDEKYYDYQDRGTKSIPAAMVRVVSMEVMRQVLLSKARARLGKVRRKG